QIEDRRFNSGRKIIRLTWNAAFGAGHEPARDILDKDKVARCDAAILDRQSLPVQRLPDKGRGHVAPHRMRRSAPAPGAKDLAWSINILEPGSDNRQLVPRGTVVAVHLAELLSARVRAVVKERSQP